MMIKKVFLSSWFIFSLLVFIQYGTAQSFVIDDDVPVQILTDTTEITYLTSRMGSRFSLSPAFKDAGVHTGAMGFDLDELTELLISVETSEGEFCFRTAQAPSDMQYFINQEARMGMTGLQLSGETPGGFKVFFTLVSPFTTSDNLEDVQNIKKQIVPAFYFLVDVINQTGEAQQGEFKIGFRKRPVEPVADFMLRNWAWENYTHQLYFADNSQRNTKNMLSALREKGQRHFSHKGFNGLSTPLDIKNGDTTRDTLIYATCFDGVVLTDKKYHQPLQFYYLNFWENVNEVVDYATQHADKLIMASQNFEKIITRSSTTPEEKWVMALTFRNDLANTFFLRNENNEPSFFVVEGRFRHLNTVDVAHETELMAVFAPWRLKLQLETWTDYIARKEVVVSKDSDNPRASQHLEGMSASEYGPFIYHDVGDQPNVSPQSDYQYGPHMAVEENCNFALMLYWYWKLTGDDAFVRSHLGTLDILLYSVLNRDTNGNGLVDRGFGWTTYDKSDAIKRSPENVYLGVKQTMAYLVAADMFEQLMIPYRESENDYRTDVEDGTGSAYGDGYSHPGNETLRKKQSQKYRSEADIVMNTLLAAYQKYGYLPASLDETFEGWDQHSVVLGEGLFLPGLAGFESEELDELVDALKNSYKKAFEKSTKVYGITLSSDEPDTWFSKVMASDIVAGYWYDIPASTAHYTYQWNKNNNFAYNDGVESDQKGGYRRWTGFWYPRGVSSLGYIFRERQFVAPQRNEFLKDLK